MAKPATKISLATAVLIVLFFFAAIGGFPEVTVWIFQLGVSFLFGWAPYFVRSVSQAHFNWKPIALGGAYFIALLAGTHYFLRWFSREMNRMNAVAGVSSGMTWRISYTLRAFALFFLAFFAGMMLIGIAHQTAWLATSPKPFFHQRPESAAFRCAMNLKNIGLALAIYASTHGSRYPDEIAELLQGDNALLPDALICPTASKAGSPDNHPQCSYLYFGKGHTSAEADAVIALDPPANHEDAGIMVLYGDGHVEWIEIDKAGDILLQHGFERIEPAQAPYLTRRDAAP